MLWPGRDLSNRIKWTLSGLESIREIGDMERPDSGEDIHQERHTDRACGEAGWCLRQAAAATTIRYTRKWTACWRDLLKGVARCDGGQSRYLYARFTHLVNGVPSPGLIIIRVLHHGTAPVSIDIRVSDELSSWLGLVSLEPPIRWIGPAPQSLIIAPP